MTVRERIEKKDEFKTVRFLVIDPEVGKVPVTTSEIESLKEDVPIWGYETEELQGNSQSGATTEKPRLQEWEEDDADR